MDKEFQSKFTGMWTKYFPGAPLPITFYYTDNPAIARSAVPGAVPRCIVAALGAIREGSSLAFDVESVGCPGGKKYLGFKDMEMPNFDYFISCGIPGKVVGERYKKSPELVKQWQKNAPSFHAPAKFIVFKRWDNLEAADRPEVAIFYATPDVLSGLFTLANFEEAEPNCVFTPFGSGCSSLIMYPFLEKDSSRPRAVIGTFDVSARPFIGANELSFAVPISRLIRMVDNAEESFLITDSWKTVRKRIKTG
jgi:hypothetical protein